MSAEEVCNLLSVKLDKKSKPYYAVTRDFYVEVGKVLGIEMDKFLVGDSYREEGATVKSTDNSGLIEGEYGALKKGLQEKIDIEWIPTAAWEKLSSMYDIKPAIKRNIVLIGLRQEPQIEMFPLFARVSEVDAKGNILEEKAQVTLVSQHGTLEHVVNEFKSPSKQEGRCWARGLPTRILETMDLKNKEKEWVIIPKDMQQYKLSALELQNGIELCIDWKNAEGMWSKQGGNNRTRDFRDFEVNDEIDAKDRDNTWYESVIRLVQKDKNRVQVHFNAWSADYDEWFEIDSPKLAPRNSHTSGPHVPRSQRGRFERQNSMADSGQVKGAVGLNNLGNTCFMNSTIQCLSNTPKLTEFFVGGDYKAQINRTNPLGWRGKIADSWGNLMTEMWSGDFARVNPSQFKTIIGEFQPRFNGYQQQDSQELLGFLLDGLHEDLNRVKDKPATEQVEDDGKSEPSVIAKKAWDTHSLRNQSVIVDLIQGQYQSTVVCPDCGRTSVTFDPFTSVPVPVPAEVPDSKLRFAMVRYASNEKKAEKPMIYEVPVGPYMKFSELTREVHNMLNMTSSIMWTTVGDNCLQQVKKPASSVETHRKTLVVGFELPSHGSSDYQTFEVTHYFVKKNILNTKNERFGYPTLVAVKRADLATMNVSELRALMKNSVAPMLEGGWQPEETDDSLYHMEVMDQMATKFLNKIDYTAETTNLNDPYILAGKKKPISLACIWNKTGVDRWIKGFESHSSAEKKKVKEGLDVYDCLEQFTKTEKLDAENVWYCRVCKKHQEATKALELWRVPDVLIVHLKRFKHTKYSRDKIDRFVDFPIEGLDLTKIVKNGDKTAIYDLYAISNHYGGLGGGHYTAFAKNLVNSKWYNLDDASAREVDESEIKTKAAYVLFYARREFVQSKY